MPCLSNWRMGSKFVDESLRHHNEHRKKHGVPSLKENKQITAIAQKWADHLAKTGTFQHSTKRDFKGERMGENIAMKWTSSGDDFTGQMVSDQWYAEKNKYNFSTSSGTGTGHTSPNTSPTHAASNYRDLPSGGTTSTETSKRVMTETRNGKTVTKTIITETKTLPDGKKEITTRETVTEGGAEASGGYNSNFDRRFGELGIKDKDSGWTTKTTKSEHKDEKKEKEKKPQKLKDFIDDVVKCHNKYRKKHGKVGDLKKNKDLDVLAQRWADHLGATKVLKHSEDTYKGDKLGENVASRWSSAGADYTGQEVTDQWYSEVSKYDFVNRDYTPGAGHFSQVVWKGSKEIGVGKCLTKDGRVFVVCNYFPAGNMLGDFKDNVLPEK